MKIDLEKDKVYVITHPANVTKHLFASKQLNDTWLCVTETKDQGKTVEFFAPCQVKDMLADEMKRVEPAPLTEEPTPLEVSAASA